MDRLIRMRYPMYLFVRNMLLGFCQRVYLERATKVWKLSVISQHLADLVCLLLQLLCSLLGGHYRQHPDFLQVYGDIKLSF